MAKEYLTEGQFDVLHSALYALHNRLESSMKQFCEKYGYTKDEIPEYMHGEYDELIKHFTLHTTANSIIWNVLYDLKKFKKAEQE